MNELQSLAEKFQEFRKTRKTVRFKYPKHLKEGAMLLAKTHTYSEIASKLSIHPITIVKWKRAHSDRNEKSGFAKIVNEQLTSQTGNEFKVTIKGISISFSKEPCSKWFAQLLGEL